MEAHLLSLNDFSRPKVLDKSNAEYVNIIYLLLLSKGKYQSHPTMGVGIRERFRYNNSENLLYDLKNEITAQLNQFLPSIQVVSVDLTLKNTVLGIIISTSAGAYVLAYDSNKDIIDAAAEYILDDL